ncbi:transposase [Escherichia coli]|uniref:Transposase n=1 Tax=Escherichia coli TaxID=562 RepID=A0A376NUK8_ECOLX|nr:transposase [Escherichia coli]
MVYFTNSTEFSPKQVMKLYSRRMQIEQNFRDEKILAGIWTTVWGNAANLLI